MREEYIALKAGERIRKDKLVYIKGKRAYMVRTKLKNSKDK